MAYFKSFLVLGLAVLASGQNATSTLESCLDKAGVRVDVPSDTAWASDTAHFQFRLQVAPAAIAFPTTNDQVASSLHCARAASVKVRALARGHSFQGFSFGEAGNLVIDMAAFNTIAFDPSTSLLRIGGAAQVAPAAKYLWDTFRRHTPHVRGSHVGLTGSSMGGGFGTTSRFLGIPADNLESVEYMLADGSVVNAGPGSDLQWAARGAGPNFGIVLSATLKTHSLPSETVVSYVVNLNSRSPSTAAAAFVAIQDFCTSSACPDELSLRFNLGTYQSAGYFYGSPSTFDATMAPLLASLRTIFPTANLTKKEMSFWDSEVEGTGAGMNAPDGGPLGGRAFYIQSYTTTTDHPFTAPQMTALLSSYAAYNRTDVSKSGFIDMWGGVSRDVQDSDAAFTHGRNLWLVRVDGVANSGVFPDGGTRYMKALTAPFEQSLVDAGTPLRSFVNYIDMELPVSEWSRRLYGGNWERLRAIKKAVDPTELFSGYALAIPVDGGAPCQKTRRARRHV